MERGRDAGLEELGTIVIGAGPAGLAVGACLKRAELPFVILEESDAVGSAWRSHYERLHLHTDKGHSALPFMPLGKDLPRYPSREQVVSYLEAYAREFGLEPRFGQRVVRARREDGLWRVDTQDTEYLAPNLVVATGYNREPVRPTWPGEDEFRGRILHSSEYRNGEPFRGQRALVVGFGNSGGEIAIDLWEHGARPTMAVRGAVNVIPRELFGIPILAIGIAQRSWPPQVADAMNALILRAAVGDLTRYGLKKLPRGPMTQIHQDARIPLIDVGTVALIQRGELEVRPGVERFTERGVVFTDGRAGDFDAVILATGYRPRVNAFLEGADAALRDGTPVTSGREVGGTGLYFCGFYVSPTGMLREIAMEARRIGEDIARKEAVRA